MSGNHVENRRMANHEPFEYEKIRQIKSQPKMVHYKLSVITVVFSFSAGQVEVLERSGALHEKGELDPPHRPRRRDHVLQPGLGCPRVLDGRRLRHRALECVQSRWRRCRRRDRFARDPGHIGSLRGGLRRPVPGHRAWTVPARRRLGLEGIARLRPNASCAHPAAHPPPRHAARRLRGDDTPRHPGCGAPARRRPHEGRKAVVRHLNSVVRLRHEVA